jgi:serine/threonine protein kinase
MEPVAPESSTCPDCGGALEKTSSGGLSCTLCLLRVGIGGEADVPQDSTLNAFEGNAHFGVYEIERREDGSLYELGHGAMGVTYRAFDTTLQRKAALKIITIGVARGSTGARERFVREARAAAALRHENIATVFQFGIREQTGQCFYAMELIEGETLEERVRRTGPLNVCTTIEIAQQVTSALAAAEKRGLIHRDLKPANLMLVHADESEVVRRNHRARRKAMGPPQYGPPTVKIIDFGLAKALNAPVDPMRLTWGSFVGTPAFASPEQFENTALDVRSDVYSLGVTLWFALTGKTPVGGHSIEEIRRAQQLSALPTEQLKAARVPSHLRSLLKAMLAFEPAARPGTHELAVRLPRCAAQASGVGRTRVALAAAAVLILGAPAFSVFHSLRNHPPAAGSTVNPTGLEKSIAVLPVENLGYVQRRQGRWEESKRDLVRAVEFNPPDLDTPQQIAISYDLFQRYPEENLVLDPALATEPNYVETRVVRGFVDLDRKADTRPLHQVTDEIRVGKPSPSRSPSFSSLRSVKKARARSAWQSRPKRFVLSVQSVTKFISWRARPRSFSNEGRRATGPTRTGVSIRDSRSRSGNGRDSASWRGGRQLSTPTATPRPRPTS